MSTVTRQRSRPIRTTRGRRHYPVRYFAVIATLVGLGVVLALSVDQHGASPHAQTALSAQSGSALHLGAYSGPGSKGVKGMQAFDGTTHTTSTETLDFPPTNSWSQIEGQAWLLKPHADQGQRLEYSLPLVPDLPGTSLSACATGLYNQHWLALGRNLLHFALANTVIRPGWEFNGTWYKWSAAGHQQQFIRCFRNVVTTMRSVSGEHFTFDWNPTNGKVAFNADQAYPGDRYVDYIGDDVYDESWGSYRAGSSPSSKAQSGVLNQTLTENRGLNFWATFAKAHGKRLAITEWGVALLSNGHGGGDDPAFIDAMFAFMHNGNNDVAFEHYFNTSSPSTNHALTGHTHFPKSLRRFQADAGG